MSLTAEHPASGLRGNDEFEAYRSMSATAVVSALLGIVSIVALLGFTALLAIPALGLLAGLVAWRQITLRPDELTGLQAAKVGMAASAFFLVAGFAQPYIVRYVETPAGYQPISYEKELVNEASPDAPTSAAVDLDGARVFLKGYMFPTSHQNGITRFLLCRDSGDCCFGTTPKKTHMVYVEMVDARQTEFSTQVRHVGGTFHVAKTRSADVNSDVLYRLDADYIK